MPLKLWINYDEAATKFNMKQLQTEIFHYYFQRSNDVKM